MNAISEALLRAVDVVIDEKTSQLRYDKTIQATIYSLVNLDTGEYKVRYNSNIFSAYAEDLTEKFKDGDTVYVIVPEGNFSKRKVISHKITNHSLSAAQISQLSNSVIEISPQFEDLGYNYETRETKEGQEDNPYGLIAGAREEALEGQNYVPIYTSSFSYLTGDREKDGKEKDYEYSDEEVKSIATNLRFQQYANQYEYIRIQASFLTALLQDHTKGDYGLEVCFYAKDELGTNMTEAIYRLNLNSFTGDPYHLSVYSPQSVIVKAQKNYLLGLKYIRFYEEDFSYDQDSLGNRIDEAPNLFVKDISLRYVEVQDLSEVPYYLAISAGQGISFNSSIDKLRLEGVLIHDSRDALNSDTCICKWFKRDLTVMVGDERYDKNVGFGWAQISSGDFTKEITIRNYHEEEGDQQFELLGIDQQYKLLVIYNDNITLTSEITLFNQQNKYAVSIEQVTEGDNIYLQLNKTDGDEDLVANWYYSNPDGSYIKVIDGKYRQNSEGEWVETDLPAPRTAIKEHLLYSSVTFYCEVFEKSQEHKEYDKYLDELQAYKNGESEKEPEEVDKPLITKPAILTNLTHVVTSSESEEDVIITYEGEDSFRYDANGDITIEDSEKERTLQVHLAWKDGVGSAYKLEWLDRSGRPLPRSLTEVEQGFKLDSSMLDKLWVDSNNILHYTIKQKYKNTFNNNSIYIKITTVDEHIYQFEKEIMFVKDGDQGTNGTTYVIALRPTRKESVGDNIAISDKLSGFQALQYGKDDSLCIGCYVYKDGELINNREGYKIDYKWRAEGVDLTPLGGLSLDSGYNEVDRVLANLKTPPTEDSAVYYVKVEVQIREIASDKTFYVYSLYPIDVLYGTIPEEFDTTKVDVSDLPSYIQYTASGLNPSFYSNDLNVYYDDENKESPIREIKSRNTNLIDITTNDDGRKYLNPASSFIFENVKNNNSGNIGALEVAFSRNEFPQGVILVHSIVMYLNTFGNEAINGWDGTSIEIKDKDDSGDAYLLAPQVGAGKKDENNTFTGVVMGKDTGQDRIGLYGYQKGVNTFGLMDNGKAYFGAKTGGGQIVLDGRYATITGGDTSVDENGSVTYSDNGMFIQLADNNEKVRYSTPAIVVGKGSNQRKTIANTGLDIYDHGKFEVDYNGSLYAQNAYIEGAIYADVGKIGGTSARDGWTIERNRISSGTSSEYVALDSGLTDNNNPQRDGYTNGKYAIWAGRQIAAEAPFSVTRKGEARMLDAELAGYIYAKGGRIGYTNRVYDKTNDANTYYGGWLIDSNSLSNEVYVAKDNNQITYYSDSLLKTQAGTLSAEEAAKLQFYKEIKGDYYYFISNGAVYWVNGNALKTTEGNTIRLSTNGTYAIQAGKKTNIGNLSSPSDRTPATAFAVTHAGKIYAADAVIYGKITANEGLIGGWKIGASTNKYRLESSYTDNNNNFTQNTRIYLDGQATGEERALYISSSASAPSEDASGGEAGDSSGFFYVTANGHMFAKGATIRGTITSTDGKIGGWTISPNSISKGSVGMSSASGKAFYAGVFNSSGTDGTGGDDRTSAFEVSHGGQLTCSNAIIRGKITSTNGQIGGWSIGKDELYIQNQQTKTKAVRLINYEQGTQVKEFQAPSYSSQQDKTYYGKVYGAIIDGGHITGAYIASGRAIMHNGTISGAQIQSGFRYSLDASQQFSQVYLARGVLGFHDGPLTYSENGEENWAKQLKANMTLSKGSDGSGTQTEVLRLSSTVGMKLVSAMGLSLNAGGSGETDKGIWMHNKTHFQAGMISDTLEVGTDSTKWYFGATEGYLTNNAKKTTAGSALFHVSSSGSVYALGDITGASFTAKTVTDNKTTFGTITGGNITAHGTINAKQGIVTDAQAGANKAGIASNGQIRGTLLESHGGNLAVYNSAGATLFKVAVNTGIVSGNGSGLTNVHAVFA